MSFIAFLNLINHTGFFLFYIIEFGTPCWGLIYLVAAYYSNTLCNFFSFKSYLHTREREHSDILLNVQACWMQMQWLLILADLFSEKGKCVNLSILYIQLPYLTIIDIVFQLLNTMV